MTIYSTSLPSPFGLLTVTATCDGVCALSFEGEKVRHDRYERKASPGNQRLYRQVDLDDLSVPSKEQQVLKVAVDTLQRYFDGSEIELAIPLAPSGTPFQRTVWRVLLTIPYGETRSYGWVAEQLGMKYGARAVGGACGSNPIPVIIPCHRVIASNGNIGGYSGGGAGEGISIKRGLLALEGVTV
ncbi:MAG: methylated-DNA--[protein]-cysteine S-methyltransferase [Thermodesulfobacteriota bacterium]